jgi:DNA-binding NarL/FixJ family response regulator
LVLLRCLIVDDNPSLPGHRPGASRAARSDDRGVASTSADALREAETLRPDVVLVDVSLAEESGSELARRLAADHARGAMAI